MFTSPELSDVAEKQKRRSGRLNIEQNLKPVLKFGGRPLAKLIIKLVEVLENKKFD